ncbi:hypothetical protein ATG_02780 [Desulfurococcaceae archaeon AG1]|jgi:hypothetical protein|nr:MAG: hypothetical protein DJ555_07515 [Desulfurococcaceae archaeon]GAY25075.1 hypothetical protein ATG_02780 [Desulfurococcaceae archaeon AG1]
MASDVSKTRGYLKSFGVSVTNYEEEMLKLIERAGKGVSTEDLVEAIRLTENLNKRLIEIVEHVLSIEIELLRELISKTGSGGARV